jgi:hypothetical protein
MCLHFFYYKDIMPESIALNPPQRSLVNLNIPSTKGSLPNLNQLLVRQLFNVFQLATFLTTFLKPSHSKLFF